MTLEFLKDDSTKAVVLGSLSGIMVAVTNLSVKIGSATMSPFQILLFMSIGQLLLVSTIAVFRRKGFCFERKDAVCLICRSISMTAARMFYYVAIARLPVFDAETIKNTRSIFTLLFLVITCQERLGFVEFGAGFITFGGIVLVCKPTFIFGGAIKPIDPIGVAFALMSAMCHAMGYLFTKKIPEVHYTVMLFYEFTFHLFFSLLLVIVLQLTVFPTTALPYIVTVIATLSLFSTNSLQILALAYGSASIVAITINLNVPALFVLQASIQDIIPSYLTLIGSVLVLIGVFLITFKATLNQKLSECRARLCSKYERVNE